MRETGSAWWLGPVGGATCALGGWCVRGGCLCVAWLLIAPAPLAAAPPAGEGHKAAKLKVREERIKGISKVVGISKLK